MTTNHDRRHDDTARRKAVRRTVLLFVAIAVAIYVGFILRGVLAS
jgi:hypothetical protein